LGERCIGDLFQLTIISTARFLCRGVSHGLLVDYVGGGGFATLARCLAGISETEARSLGALAVLKAVGWMRLAWNNDDV
jgi:hypothetical protein